MTRQWDIQGTWASARLALFAIVLLFLANCHDAPGTSGAGVSHGGSGGGGGRGAGGGAGGGDADSGGRTSSGTDRLDASSGEGGIAGDAAGVPGYDSQIGDAGGLEVGACLGVCLETLFLQCSKLGQSCVQSASGSQTTRCYSNGVKMLATQSGDTTTTILKKANGDVCFQDTVSASTKTETIYDPAGVETAVILGAGYRG